VESGHWPLLRYDPRRAEQGENPLRLDSKPPSIPYEAFARTEARFSMLARANPEAARTFLEQAQREVSERYHRYEQLAGLSWEAVAEPQAEQVNESQGIQQGEPS
jgi:pyruvate-ferredoxin/flavodoxin oxidoreductase